MADAWRLGWFRIERSVSSSRLVGFQEAAACCSKRHGIAAREGDGLWDQPVIAYSNPFVCKVVDNGFAVCFTQGEFR